MHTWNLHDPVLQCHPNEFKFKKAQIILLVYVAKQVFAISKCSNPVKILKYV